MILYLGNINAVFWPNDPVLVPLNAVLQPDDAVLQPHYALLGPHNSEHGLMVLYLGHLILHAGATSPS